MIDETVLVKKNILIVDDDSIANFLIEKIVQSTGLARNIYKALNGKEALDVFFRHITNSSPIPDVVLLDLNMPIMNGFEFLQAFSQLDFHGKKDVLIVLVTSSNNPSDIEKSRSFGIRHYITKPLTAENLRSIFETEFAA